MITLKTGLLSLLIAGSTYVFSSTDSHAAVADRVVAVVNNEVLTQQDVDKRFQLVMRQIKKHPSKAQQQALYQNTLDTLITEEIRNQYAKSRGLRVSKKEMDLAIATVEKNNNLSQGGFYNLTKGLTDTAKRRIETDLLWTKVVDQIVRPNVKVSPQEVDQLISNISNGDSVTEKELYQIFVKSDTDSDQAAADKANDIYESVMKNKKSFIEIARTQNDSKSTKNDGFMGWLKNDELQVTLNKTLSEMSKGDISKPVQTPSGWHILYVKDVRESVKYSNIPIDAYTYYEMTVKLPENADDAKEIRKTVEKAVRKFNLKGDMKEFVLKNKESMDITGNEVDLLAATLMPSILLERLKDIDVEEFSDVQLKNGMLSIIYLEKITKVLPSKLQKYRNNIRQRLMANRLDMAIKRFSREIRRSAYVEMRN